MSNPIPASLTAEQSILGAVLQRPDLAEQVFAVARPEMFWEPRHATLAAVLVAMHDAGLPIDPQTVLARLMASGDVRRLDGPYLLTLVERAWQPANALAYAEEVRECYRRRMVGQAAERITQQIGNPEVETETLVVELAGVVDVAQDLATARDPVRPSTLDDLLAGSDEQDWVVPGLVARRERIILTGFEGLGKALALETPVPTPKGWTTMGALSVGDQVFGPDGKPARVVAATGTMHGRPCRRITFSDGARIVADAQHRWLTETLPAREAAARAARRSSTTRPRGTDQRHKRVHFPAVVTTDEIAATLHARRGHALNHSVAVCAPLEYPRQELPLEPYVLGAWLGDGNSRGAGLSSADLEIVERIRALGEPVVKDTGPYAWRLTEGSRTGEARRRSVQARLRALGLLENKHIPAAYLHASVDQRLELLRGLMDTDGTIGLEVRGGLTCEFSVCNERLARDVLELLHGLGIKVVIRSGDAVLERRVVGTRWRLAFQTDLPVFHLSRKLERMTPLRTRRAKLRYVTAVEQVASVPVRCIQVDRADGMFVVGRECIPTHNSELAAQVAVAAAAGIHPFTGQPIDPHRVLVVDLENGDYQMRCRYRRIDAVVSAIGGVWDHARLMVEIRDEGVDLRQGDDVAWLDRLLAAARPDLVCIGPLYKMHRDRMEDEQAARLLAHTLDTLRVRHNCALLIEAHSGHAEELGGRRKVRPRGSSLFLGWPNVGIGLRPHQDAVDMERPNLVEVKHWRGAREAREWPRVLARSGDGVHGLPWTAYTPTAADKAAARLRRAELEQGGAA
jgi:replicative DNA helicase